jgi:hypothetical protein
MTHVSCPACERKLALPEESWRGMAQCPACRAIFRPGSSQYRQMEHLRPAPTQFITSPDHHFREGQPKPKPVEEEPESNFHKRFFQAGFVLGALFLLLLGIPDYHNAEAVISQAIGAAALGCIIGFLFLTISLFWENIPLSSREASLGQGSKKKKIAVGLFIVGTLAAAGFGLVKSTSAEENRWLLSLLTLCCAPVTGALLAFMFLVLAGLYEGFQVLPTLLTFAGEEEEPEDDGIPRISEEPGPSTAVQEKKPPDIP